MIKALNFILSDFFTMIKNILPITTYYCFTCLKK